MPLVVQRWREADPSLVVVAVPIVITRDRQLRPCVVNIEVCWRYVLGSLYASVCILKGMGLVYWVLIYKKESGMSRKIDPKI